MSTTKYDFKYCEADSLHELIEGRYERTDGLKKTLDRMINEGWEVHQIDHSTVTVTNGYGNLLPKFFCIVTFKKQTDM